MIEGVIFDLDGLLLETERVWDAVRERLVRERGGNWQDGAQSAMMGMSSPEWSRYMHDELGLREPPEAISAEVVARMAATYRAHLPLLPGAVLAVERLSDRWPLGLASSSNRELIDLALELAGLDRHFAATVSSEEVGRGKPAPDVYLEAARRLGVAPERSAAVEDSASGIGAALAAGMAVVAIPNREFPPPAELLSRATVTLSSLTELTAEVVSALPDLRGPTADHPPLSS